MDKCLVVLVFFALAVSAGGIPPITLYTNTGLGLPNLNDKIAIPTTAPQIGLKVTDQSTMATFEVGVGADWSLNEYLRLSTGFLYEHKGALLKGTVYASGVSSGNGYQRIDFHYLTIPVYAKGIASLLIPGNVFLALGPEIGFNIDAFREDSGRIKRSPITYSTLVDTIIYSNIKKETAPMDLAIGVMLGYELPIGWNTGIVFQGSYSLGLINVSKKSGTSLYNRTLRICFAYYVNLQAGKP
jgi:hypothetical protein